jgi:preprotein translocase subunit SecE
MNITQKIKEFFKEVLVEMRRVSWLSRKDVFKYTGIVLIVIVLVALFLGGLDYLFNYLIKTFILN